MFNKNSWFNIFLTAKNSPLYCIYIISLNFFLDALEFFKFLFAKSFFIRLLRRVLLIFFFISLKLFNSLNDLFVLADCIVHSTYLSPSFLTPTPAPILMVSCGIFVECRYWQRRNSRFEGGCLNLSLINTS